MNDFQKEMREYGVLLNGQLSSLFDTQIQNSPAELEPYWLQGKQYTLNGGKRVRPFWFHKLAKISHPGFDASSLCLSLELLHNSTLIDDDIIDHHDTRRHAPTLPVSLNSATINGSDASLVVANLFYSLGHSLLVERIDSGLFLEAIKIYDEIYFGVNQGQLLDLTYRQRFDITEKQYEHQTYLVAALFIEQVFFLATTEYREQYARIGKLLGLIFQYVDDLLDISEEDNKGRGVGADIREGAQTLLSIKTYPLLSDLEQERFRAIFGGGESASLEDINWIIEQYRKHGADKYVQERTRLYANEIHDILGEVSSPFSWISDLVDYSLSRTS